MTQQLGDERDDLALSWMAHHVARLMTEANAAAGSESHQAQERCRRAILDLWQARRAFFDRVPMQSVEEVGAALLALKNGDDWFFRRTAYDEVPPARGMQMAHAVDSGARAIIRTLVGDAVREGVAAEKDWIWLVRSGLPDIEPIILLIQEALVTSQSIEDVAAGSRSTDSESEASDAKGADRTAKRTMKSERDDIIERLREFASLAEQIASHLATPRRARKGAGKRVNK